MKQPLLQSGLSNCGRKAVIRVKWHATTYNHTVLWNAHRLCVDVLCAPVSLYVCVCFSARVLVPFSLLLLLLVVLCYAVLCCGGPVVSFMSRSFSSQNVN